MSLYTCFRKECNNLTIKNPKVPKNKKNSSVVKCHLPPATPTFTPPPHCLCQKKCISKNAKRRFSRTFYILSHDPPKPNSSRPKNLLPSRHPGLRVDLHGHEPLWGVGFVGEVWGTQSERERKADGLVGKRCFKAQRHVIIETYRVGWLGLGGLGFLTVCLFLCVFVGIAVA